MVFGLNARSTAVRHQRFTGPSPPAPLRTKATTKLADESQMSRQPSKPSQPRSGESGTHTPPITHCGAVEEERERGECVPLRVCVGVFVCVCGARGEMRICEMLRCLSVRLMSVCVCVWVGRGGRKGGWTVRRTDGWKNGDSRAQGSYSVMPVAINALTHSSWYARPPRSPQEPWKTKSSLFYDGNVNLVWITCLSGIV